MKTIRSLPHPIFYLLLALSRGARRAAALLSLLVVSTLHSQVTSNQCTPNTLNMSWSGNVPDGVYAVDVSYAATSSWAAGVVRQNVTMTGGLGSSWLEIGVASNCAGGTDGTMQTPAGTTAYTVSGSWGYGWCATTLCGGSSYYGCQASCFGTAVAASATIMVQDPPGTHLTPGDSKDGGDQKKDCFGMARYSVHSMLVSLNVIDTPVGYTPSRGPAIDFTATYNQKETYQPATFTYSNLGPKWTFDWLSYVSDDPNTQLPSTTLYRAGGGAEIFAFDSASQTFIPDAQSHATLVRTGAATYERRMPDGSKQVFGQSDGATSYPRKIFMTQVVDPAGNTLTIGYDASFRVVTVTDALGQVTNIYYELAADPYKITTVTDPFGRFATFEYTNGLLTRITDEIGIQSQFTYAPGTDAIDSLTTPYGRTTFTRGQNGTNR